MALKTNWVPGTDIIDITSLRVYPGLQGQYQEQVLFHMLLRRSPSTARARVVVPFPSSL